MTADARLWLLALTFFTGFGALGYVVATYALSGIDIRAQMFRGDLTAFSILLTRSGRAVPLLLLALVSVGIYAVLHRPVWVPLAVFASQVTSQGFVEAIKRIFRRTRPTDWLHRQERGHSYPSGHATTAIVFYGTWFLIAFHAQMAHPLKFVVCFALLIWLIGIDWSRMALGAHYFSDILGGTLFGCAWMCVLLALLLHFHVSLAGA